MALRILVIDDQSAIADTLAEMLSMVGYECAATYNSRDALTYTREWQPALVITDVVMPDMSGVELGKRVRELCPSCVVLLYSGNVATQELLEAARSEGYSFHILAKPAPPKEMFRVVASILENQNAENQNAASGYNQPADSTQASTKVEK